METLSHRYHLPVPNRYEGFRADLATMRAGVDGEIGDPATLFSAAIAFEQRAAAFFSERVHATPPGSVEHQLYRELAAEEMEHVALLETELALWVKGREGVL